MGRISRSELEKFQSAIQISKRFRKTNRPKMTPFQNIRMEFLEDRIKRTLALIHITNESNGVPKERKCGIIPEKPKRRSKPKVLNPEVPVVDVKARRAAPEQKQLLRKAVHNILQKIKKFPQIFKQFLLAMYSMLLHLQSIWEEMSKRCFSVLKIAFRLALWPLYWLKDLIFCSCLLLIAMIVCTYEVIKKSIFSLIPFTLTALKFIEPYCIVLTKWCWSVLKFFCGLIWYPLVWLCGWYIEGRQATVQVTPPPQLEAEIIVDVEVQVTTHQEQFPVE